MTRKRRKRREGRRRGSIRRREGGIFLQVKVIAQSIHNPLETHMSRLLSFRTHEQLREQKILLDTLRFPSAKHMKVAEKLTFLESSLASPDGNLSNGEFFTKLISHGRVEFRCQNLSNHFFPTETMEDPALLPNQASLEEQSRDDQLKNPKYGSDYSPETVRQTLNRALIDRTAPFESVKEAVSKFGAILDWKAHRIQTLERQKRMGQELEKAREEISEYRRWSEAAEEAKMKVLKELGSTKRLIEELKLNLERAKTEENQAKRDSELAMLRLEELEQGIADDASVAVKTQLEVARARHTAAISELKSVKAEMETLRKEYDSLVREKDIAIDEVEAAMAAWKEAEKTVEELTIELIAEKELLDTSRTFHLEAEETRVGAALAREQDLLNWEKELKEANEEIQRLNQQVMSVKDLTWKLDSASTLLLDLRTELASFMELKLKETVEEGAEKMEKKTHEEMQAAIALATKELEEVKVNIKKAISKVDCLKVAAISLRSELEGEKSALSIMREREGMASIAVSALESEVENTLVELALVQMKEKEARENISELPKQLQLLATEVELTKSAAQTAREEMQKAKEEAEQAKAAARTIETRLIAAQREIEASKASKKLALAVMKALKESESSRTTIEMDSPSRVTLSLEDYYELSKRAYEAEEQAGMRVSSSISQIKIAMESESKSWATLEEVNREVTARKEALKIAKKKAKEGKLGVEQELRKWRAEQEQTRPANESGRNAIKSPTTDSMKKDSTKLDQAHKASSPASHGVSPKPHLHPSISRKNSISESKIGKKKRNSFFPRILMFFGRRKRDSNKVGQCYESLCFNAGL